MEVICKSAAECYMCHSVKVSVASDYNCKHKLCKECNLEWFESKETVLRWSDGKLVTSFLNLCACCPVCCALPLSKASNCGLCQTEVLDKYMDIHLRKCSKIAITCLECNSDIAAGYIGQHRCNDGNVECGICNELIPEKYVSEHMGECGWKTFLCSECNEKVFYKKFSNVFNHNCETDIFCKYCNGCIPNTNEDKFDHYDWCGVELYHCEFCETTITNGLKSKHVCWNETCRTGNSSIYVEKTFDN